MDFIAQLLKDYGLYVLIVGIPIAVFFIINHRRNLRIAKYRRPYNCLTIRFTGKELGDNETWDGFDNPKK